MIERDELLRIARMARLALDPGEVERLRRELDGILVHVAVLRECDVTDVPPFASAAEEAGAPREDEPSAERLAHEPGAMAPAWRDGFYTVPRLDSHRFPEHDA